MGSSYGQQHCAHPGARTSSMFLLLLFHLCRSCPCSPCCCQQVKKAPPPEPSSAGGPSEAPAEEGGEGGEGKIAIGKLRGEDYNFEFQGKVKDGKMHFRLFMTQVRAGDEACWRVFGGVVLGCGGVLW